jgi:hypothetical protein
VTQGKGPEFKPQYCKKKKKKKKKTKNITLKPGAGGVHACNSSYLAD